MTAGQYCGLGCCGMEREKHGPSAVSILLLDHFSVFWISERAVAAFAPFYANGNAVVVHDLFFLSNRSWWKPTGELGAFYRGRYRTYSRRPEFARTSLPNAGRSLVILAPFREHGAWSMDDGTRTSQRPRSGKPRLLEGNRHPPGPY
jgi:hypothetical protein